jgi:hypothetical protein
MRVPIRDFWTREHSDDRCAPGQKGSRRATGYLALVNWMPTLFGFFLFQKFMIPLKSGRTLDSNLVDDIFYKVNEIYMHHATFLTFLGKAVTSWDHKTTIGDVIYRNVSSIFLFYNLFQLMCDFINVCVCFHSSFPNKL